MEINNMQKSHKISRIAFHNPYLAAGHVTTAEIETAARLIQAARNIGVELKVFASCEEIEYFAPDFVLALCSQAPKLTSFPTYGNMDVPPSFIKDVPRFTRNVLTWDGIYSISSVMENWLRGLHAKNNKKLNFTHAGLSPPTTEFRKADFKNAVAMYIGTNWDGQRHRTLFDLLRTGEYLKCYGPKRSWAKYPAEFYGGEVPFDGVSVLNAYNKSGAGLCIGHAAYDKEGIPSSRTYEIAAASALPICSNTELNKKIYGDAALYVDHEAATADLAAQIVDAVKWMRSNPATAAEMAHQAHTIFNEKLSMEYYLRQVIAMHERVLLDNHYQRVATRSPVQKNKVTYILAVNYVDYRLRPVLKSFADQSYDNIEIILLAKNGEAAMREMYDEYCHGALNIVYMPDLGADTRQQLFSYLSNHHTDWLGIITLDGRLAPNHVAELMAGFEASNVEMNKATGMFSSSLEFSEDIHLPELEPEEHIVPNQYRIRMASLKHLEKLPVHSLLINFNLLDNNIFSLLDFYQPRSEVLIRWLQSNGMLLPVREVTCSTKINNDQDLLNQVKVLQVTKGEMQAVINSQNHTIAALQERSNTLDLLYGSRSWRYTAIIRRVVRKAVNTLRLVTGQRKRAA